MHMNYSHYGRGYFPVPPFERNWPKKEITHAPIWCSVDLRDGNQALVAPMTAEEKLYFFSYLVKLGFKEIEVGFPAASDTEFSFIRTLIEENLIPDDVTIQVLSQIRPHILKKTFEAIDGAKNAIVHIYNSTSRVQRKAVFNFTPEETVALAEKGAAMCLEMAKTVHVENLTFEYSPESFSATEPEIALRTVNAVIDVFSPAKEHKLIINLPETVQLSTPNIYADMVEYISENMHNRENVILSIHTHNDRGCAVASSELGILAGAQRVEGTLFGNGERTGNADIMVLALNLFSQGIDPKLELSDMAHLIKTYEDSTKMPVPPRHPYAGELVYTAFSGSHQDAIKKSLEYSKAKNLKVWQNPYLPIDPEDIGRDYEPIRINSQSGAGGIRYVLESKYGIYAPKDMITEFALLIKNMSDKKASELSHEAIYLSFAENYVSRQDHLALLDYKVSSSDGETSITASFGGELEGEFTASGNGPLNALNNLLRENLKADLEIVSYSEHALEEKSSSRAMAFITLRVDGALFYGAGISTNINTASMEALISAYNRSK